MLPPGEVSSTVATVSHGLRHATMNQAQQQDNRNFAHPDLFYPAHPDSEDSNSISLHVRTILADQNRGHLWLVASSSSTIGMKDMSRKLHLSSSEATGAATKAMVVGDDDASTSSRLLDYSVQRASTETAALESSFSSICSKGGPNAPLQNFVVNAEGKDKSHKSNSNNGVKEGKYKRSKRISYHCDIPGLNIAFHNGDVVDLSSMNISNHSDIRSKGPSVKNYDSLTASAKKRGSGSSIDSQSSTKSQQQLLDDAVSATEYLLSLPLDDSGAYHAGKTSTNFGAPGAATEANAENNMESQDTNNNISGKDNVYVKTRVDTSMESPTQRPARVRACKNQKQILSPIRRTPQKPLSRVKRQTSNGSACSKGSLGSMLDISDRSRSKSPMSMSGMSASSISLRLNLDDSDSDESDNSLNDNTNDAKTRVQEEAQIPKGSCSSRLQKSFSNLIVSANAKAASSHSNEDCRRRTRSVSPKRPESRQQQFRRHQKDSLSIRSFGGDDESDNSDDDDDLWGATTNTQKHESNTLEGFFEKIANSKSRAKNTKVGARLSAHTPNDIAGESDLASSEDCINFSIRRTRSVGSNIQDILRKGASSAGSNAHALDAVVSSTERLKRSLSNVMQIAVLSEGVPPEVGIVEDGTEINKPKQTIKRTRSAGSAPLGLGLGGAPAARVSRRSRLKINRLKETNTADNGNARDNFQLAATEKVGRSLTGGKISHLQSNTSSIMAGSSKKNPSRVYSLTPQISNDGGETPVMAPSSASSELLKVPGKQLALQGEGTKEDSRGARSPSIKPENGPSIPMRRSLSSVSIGMGKKKFVSTGNMFLGRRNAAKDEQRTPVKNAQWGAQSRTGSPALERTMSRSDSQSKLAALAAMSRGGTVEPQQNIEVGERSQMPALKRATSRSDSQSKLAMLASMSRAKSQGATGAQRNAQWGSQPEVSALKRTLSKSDSVSKMAMLAALSRERSQGAPAARQSRTSLQQKTASVGNLLAEGRMPAVSAGKLSSLMVGMKQSKSQAMMPGLDHMISGLEGPESPPDRGGNASWASTRQPDRPNDLKATNQRLNPFVATIEGAQGMVTPSIGSSPRPSTPRSSEEHGRGACPIPIHKRAMPVIETSSSSETGGPITSSRRSLVTRTSSRGSASVMNMSSSRRSVSRTSSGHRRLFLDSSGQRIGPLASSDNNDALSRLSQLMGSSSATGEKTADTAPTLRRVSRTTSHKSNILNRRERLSGGDGEVVPLRRVHSKRLTGNKGSQTNLLNDTSHFVTGSRIRRFDSTSKLSN